MTTVIRAFNTHIDKPRSALQVALHMCGVAWCASVGYTRHGKVIPRDKTAKTEYPKHCILVACRKLPRGLCHQVTRPGARTCFSNEARVVRMYSAVKHRMTSSFCGGPRTGNDPSELVTVSWREGVTTEQEIFSIDSTLTFYDAVGLSC